MDKLSSCPACQGSKWERPGVPCSFCRAAPSSSADDLPPKMAWLDAPEDTPGDHARAWAKGWNDCRAAIQAAAPADAPTHPPRVTPEMVESLNAAIRLLEQAKAAREEMQARLGIAVEDAREQQPDDADNLSVMLWLLRRLPRAYGNPPFVEQAINRLAKRTGTDVADSFAERNESCRATGTDRAQAGEAPAGVKEEGKEG